MSHAEGMGPLCLVVGATEGREIGECGCDDHPLRVVLLSGCLVREVARCDAVAREDHCRDTRRLELGDDLRRLGLDRSRIQRVGQHLRQVSAVLGHAGGELVGDRLRLGARRDVHVAELSRLRGERLVAGVLGVATDQLLGDELAGMCAALGGADRETEHVRIALGVPLGRLARRTPDAHDFASGQLVGEGAGECRPSEHDERLVVLGDTYGVGAGGDLVVGQSGAHVGLELDLAPIGFVELVEHAEHVTRSSAPIRRWCRRPRPRPTGS